MKLEIRYKIRISFGIISSWFWVKIGSNCYFINSLTHSKKKRKWKHYFYSLPSLHVIGLYVSEDSIINWTRIIDSGEFEIESSELLRKLKNVNDATAALIRRLKTDESLENGDRET